jgi:hypothetical protein
MQNKKWNALSKVTALAAVTFLVVSFSTLAAAQREDSHAVLATATKISTSVAGVHAFPAPDKGFDPMTATNRELLTYGLPQRPDKTVDANGYHHWEKAMLAVKACNERSQQPHPSTSVAGQAQVCHATDVQAKPYSSVNMRSAGAPAQANVDGTTQYTSGNWSGIANTNHLTKWNTLTSFDEVVSYWNVPVPNHPLGNIPCADGPWFEVTWNGIDGFNNGDVVQGGTADYWDGGGCGGAVQTYGWVEWYPSYSILAIFCGSSLCPVGAGDDFVAETFGAPGTSEQFVFVEDITQQWSGTFGLTYVTGPGVVGSSAEYIVERPCCNGSNFFPLGNYIFEFMGYNYAYNGKGTLFYPGNTGLNTAIITMLADDGVTDISIPFLYGTAGGAGRYSIMLEDENCAYSGGCTP